MTVEENIARLCLLRDEMNKTPEGREALRQVILENASLRQALFEQSWEKAHEDVWK